MRSASYLEIVEFRFLQRIESENENCEITITRIDNEQKQHQHAQKKAAWQPTPIQTNYNLINLIKRFCVNTKNQPECNVSIL